MHQGINNWVQSCQRCKKAKGPYDDPNAKQGLLIAHDILDLLCLNFTKMNHSKDGREKVLVMMDTFSNFTVAVETAYEQKQWSKPK